MTNDHLADIGKAFDYLFRDYGFGIQQERQFESFGNWVVVLESPDCRMRIFQDRGYISIAFGPVWSPPDWEAGPWFGLEVIFEYLSVKYTLTNEDVIRELSPVSLEHLANMLKPHLKSICDLFQAEAFPSHRDKLEHIADNLFYRASGMTDNTAE